MINESKIIETVIEKILAGDFQNETENLFFDCLMKSTIQNQHYYQNSTHEGSTRLEGILTCRQNLISYYNSQQCRT